MQLIEDSLKMDTNVDMNTLTVPTKVLDDEPKPKKEETVKIEDLEVPVTITNCSEEVVNKKESMTTMTTMTTTTEQMKSPDEPAEE